MTTAQLTYPILALAEAVILFRSRKSRSQNGPALRLWLQIQLGIFCLLEPASFLPEPIWGSYYLGVTVVSAAADLMVLHSIWHCLENGFPAFGSARAWASTAILTGMLFCFAAELRIPPAANGMQVYWLTVDQAFTYIRGLCLIVLSIYGWLRASSWPQDLAWTWIGMAAYAITDAIIVRIQLFRSNTHLLESAYFVAALLQLAGWWRALSYAPKPLTDHELEAFAVLTSSTSKGSD